MKRTVQGGGVTMILALGLAGLGACAGGRGSCRRDGNACSNERANLLEALRSDYDRAAAQVKVGPQTPDAFWIAHDSAERCDLAVEALARQLDLGQATVTTSDGVMSLSAVHERCIAMADTMESWRFDVCGTRQVGIDQSRVGRGAWRRPTVDLEDGYEPVDCSKLPKRRVPGVIARLERSIVKRCGGASVVLSVLPAENGGIWDVAQGRAHRNAQAICVARGDIQLSPRRPQMTNED